MKEFISAARDEFEGDDVGEHTIKLDGREITICEPGTGTAAVMSTLTRGDMDFDKVSTFMSMFFGLIKTQEDRQHIEDRLMDRSDPFELDSEGGMLDIFFWLMDEMSGGRPPAEPTDYQPPRRATGRGSMENTRVVGSTSSRSRSRVSSQ